MHFKTLKQRAVYKEHVATLSGVVNFDLENNDSNNITKKLTAVKYLKSKENM